MLAEVNMAQVVWGMIWFFLFVIWIMLLFNVLVDLFRSDDLSGWAKAAWIIFLILFVYLGVLVYLIVRGNKMAERRVKDMQDQEAAFKSYVQDAAGSGGGAASELEKLVALKESGNLTDEEFAAMKAKLVN